MGPGLSVCIRKRPLKRFLPSKLLLPNDLVQPGWIVEYDPDAIMVLRDRDDRGRVPPCVRLSQNLQELVWNSKRPEVGGDLLYETDQRPATLGIAGPAHFDDVEGGWIHGIGCNQSRREEIS